MYRSVHAQVFPCTVTPNHYLPDGPNVNLMIDHSWGHGCVTVRALQPYKLSPDALEVHEYGVRIELSKEEVDQLIDSLQRAKEDLIKAEATGTYKDQQPKKGSA